MSSEIALKSLSLRVNRDWAATTDVSKIMRLLAVSERLEVLGSERLTGALLDRLTHRVHILQANGESFRLRDARRRRRRRTKQ